MPSPTRVAVLGAGFFGGMLARATHDHPAFDLVAVCDRDREAAQRLATAVGAAVTTELREIQDDPSIGLVMVATPNHVHCEQVIPLLAAGKDVFVEKPLAITDADARAMVAAATEHGRLLFVGHILRTLPGVRRLRDEVVAGDLGEVREVVGVRSRVVHVPQNIDDWWKLDGSRSGGEMLHELHELDLLVWLLGEPERVSSVAGGPATVGGATAHTIHRTTLAYASGAVGHHELSTTGHAAQWALRVTGSEAAVEVDFRRAEVRKFVDGVVTDTWAILDRADANDDLREAANARQAYHSHNEATAPSAPWMATAVTHELDDVARGLRGDESVLVGVPDVAVRVGLLALESATSGSSVSFVGAP